MSKIRIGCYSAFWGDTPSGATQLVSSANLDYLVGDLLAETTMGILARRRKVSETRKLGGAGAGGYVAEFVKFVWKPIMKRVANGELRVITNAGGLAPLALKEAMEQAARAQGLDICIAAVTGDDLMPSMDSLKRDNALAPFELLGQPDFWQRKANDGDDDDSLQSANAYLGARPVAEALRCGARVVVTGRVVDSALVLGPLMHEFGWRADQYDLLARGSLAGHLIECGTQATGGNFTDWHLSATSAHGGWANMGFPYVDVRADGEFVLSKPARTGGLVSRGTVGEQLLYEIGDPANYVLPDVIVDLRHVTLDELADYGGDAGVGAVLVRGARGKPPTPLYKVSSTYLDGYKLAGELVIGGVDARAKAARVADAILTRARFTLAKFGLDDFRSTSVELLGAEHTYGPHAKALETREVVLRIGVHHDSPAALRIFGAEVAPSATSMAPGITGGGSGRPRPSALMAHVSSLIDKRLVTVHVHVGKSAAPSIVDCAPPSVSQPLDVIDKPTQPNADDFATSSLVVVAVGDSQSSPEPTRRVPLLALCYGRSGDKGDMANIGLLVRHPSFLPIIKSQVTALAVRQFFAHLMSDDGLARRYELPGIGALNFLLTHSLGGGGLSSLRIDRQGKTYAQMLLTMRVDVPSKLLHLHSSL
jgi:Acyclic terpene utilisation family protein AtuA